VKEVETPSSIQRDVRVRYCAFLMAHDGSTELYVRFASGVSNIWQLPIAFLGIEPVYNILKLHNPHHLPSIVKKLVPGV